MAQRALSVERIDRFYNLLCVRNVDSGERNVVRLSNDELEALREILKVYEGGGCVEMTSKGSMFVRNFN